MSEALPYRAYALHGPDQDQALAWLYVHGDVHGVLEEESALVIWTPGALPPLPADLQVTATERVVHAEDFTVTGLENDAAILVTADLMVRPPWVARPLGFTGIELIVPRGGAFGSGEHDSTKAALVVMHRGWSSPASMADVGTGSGILALYAQVRGCARVVSLAVGSGAQLPAL